MGWRHRNQLARWRKKLFYAQFPSLSSEDLDGRGFCSETKITDIRKAFNILTHTILQRHGFGVSIMTITATTLWRGISESMDTQELNFLLHTLPKERTLREWRNQWVWDHNWSPNESSEPKRAQNTQWNGWAVSIPFHSITISSKRYYNNWRIPNLHLKWGPRRYVNYFLNEKTRGNYTIRMFHTENLGMNRFINKPAMGLLMLRGITSLVLIDLIKCHSEMSYIKTWGI